MNKSYGSLDDNATIASLLHVHTWHDACYICVVHFNSINSVFFYIFLFITILYSSCNYALISC